MFRKQLKIEMRKLSHTNDNVKIFSPCIMCVQYCGGCSVLWGVFSTVGGYHEYRGGIS